MKDIKCINCGDMTNEAPIEKWKGYCPGCVMELFMDDMEKKEVAIILAQLAMVAARIADDDDDDDIKVEIVKVKPSPVGMNVVAQQGKIVSVETTVCLN